MKIKQLLLLVVGLATVLSAHAQKLSVDGKSIVQSTDFTIRAASLDGWMIQDGRIFNTETIADSPSEIRQNIIDLIGDAEADIFWTNWYANYLQQSDLADIKSWGFNTVRIPFHYNLFTLSVQDEPVQGENTWLTEGFDMMDQAVTWAAQNQLYIIFEMRAAPGGQNNRGVSDYNASLPSLWDEAENQNKAIALWEQLAERYAGNTWVAGYDLLYEPGTGGTALQQFYASATTAIRNHDTNSLIFAQGKDGNDFTGITSSWDANLVYSARRDAVINDSESLQSYKDLQDQTGSPVVISEMAENSNVWYKGTIDLLDQEGIGWSVGPYKRVMKISSIGAVSSKTNFQRIIDYWSGDREIPQPQVSLNIMEDVASGLQSANLELHKGLIDALFNQDDPSTSRPFEVQNIPGIVDPVNFDVGPLGVAYFDQNTANYASSLGFDTQWNSGEKYRNSGMDIEESEDVASKTGFNLAFLGNGEWVEMSVNVTQDAVYDIEARVSSTLEGGKFYLFAGDARITESIVVPLTGDWQNWTSIIIPNVPLISTDTKLRLYVEQEGFNIGNLKFIAKGPSTSIDAEYVSSEVIDANTVKVDLSKPLAGPVDDLTVYNISDDEVDLTINGASLSEDKRSIILTTAQDISGMGIVRVTYSGNSINAADGSSLGQFSNKFASIQIPNIVPIPARVEAEDYFFASGVRLEDTGDSGPGQNIGWLNPDDYVDYFISVPQSGEYTVYYRTASPIAEGVIKFDIIESGGNVETVEFAKFPITGDWQKFTTTRTIVNLPQGEHRIRLTIVAPNFNLNWFEFESGIVTSTSEFIDHSIRAFPNPGKGYLKVVGKLEQPQSITLSLTDMLGRKVWNKELVNALNVDESIQTYDYPEGIYILSVTNESGLRETTRILIK